MNHEEYSRKQRIQAVGFALKILEGKIGLLEGVRELISTGFPIEDSFLIFKGVDSETDELPFGEQRKYWNKEALREKDAEILQYEEQVREAVLKACRLFVQTYGG